MRNMKLIISMKTREDLSYNTNISGDYDNDGSKVTYSINNDFDMIIAEICEQIAFGKPKIKLA